MLIIIVLIALVGISLATYIFITSNQEERLLIRNAEARGRVLIADSLSIDYPNPELINYIASLFRSKGYAVDIYYGEDVNLSLYSNLTNYEIIILRIHGGKAQYRDKDGNIRYLNGLFTGLKWRDEYLELKKQWIATRAYPFNSTEAYLAVLPKFFEEKFKGGFIENSVMIVASCFSLYTPDIADALFRRGLSKFIGWRDVVTLEHMDNVIKRLVEKVVLEDKSWDQAVFEVNNELGPDKVSNDYLKIVESSYILSG
jgi:hypothetical protein